MTLPDVRTGRRRDVYLGEHGTVESHRKYAEVVKRWVDGGRVLDGTPEAGEAINDAAADLTVAKVLIGFWRAECKRYDVSPDTRKLPSNLHTIKQAI